LDQLEPGSIEYILPSPMPWSGDVDVAALGAALSRVVARHEVLRTRLVTGADGVPHQVIDPPSPFPLPVVDVSGEADPAAARLLVAAGTIAPFDLARGPLIRACLIRLGADKHVLALAVHHVASDEWSMQIFRRELSALYGAFRAGEPDPLPPLPVQYADFAVWQRQWLAGEVLDGQLAYWRDQLAGLPVLELPTDRPRPAVRSTAGAVTRFSVPAEVADGLRGVARECGATMFMTLIAAFTMLLGRYCGADDVVVGTPVANRNRAETEDLIGFFVNTLVMRTDLSGDPAFTELLGRVREMALAAYAHQDLPFEQLVDTLVTERDRSRSPLFQVLFNYFTEEGSQDDGRRNDGRRNDGRRNGDRRNGDRARGTELSLSDLGTGVIGRFDLRLILADSGGGGLFGVFEYCTALFDAVTVERFAGHLMTVLEAVAVDGGRPVSQLPVLTDAERYELVDAWNETSAAVPPAGGVHELVVARAEECPDVVAVVSGGWWLSYGGLVGRAARLAGYLRGVGVGAESVVGVCLPRGVEMVVAVLGVWLAGGAYVPLDPEYPAERLAFMLADSRASVVVVGTRELVGDLPVGRLRTVVLDEPAVAMTLAGLPPVPPPVVVEPDGLAYVMYTSGSTGVPKGVLVPHGGVVNLAVAQGRVFGVGRGDVVVQFASWSFDASVWELVMVLVAGAQLVMASAEERAEPQRLAGLVQANGVGVATVPPSLLDVLQPGDLGGVHTLVTAGEALDPRLAGVWGRGRRLLNAYGPTETTVCASVALVDPDGGGMPPIGGPIANTRVYVLDRCLSPVPVGVAGELFIGGAQVARGYEGRPALTAERFIADPFAGDGSRLYRSGDRVRWRADGRLEFVGRTDEQVKVRGFRIEPAEIEAVLAAHPAIHTAVVTAFGQEADRRLVAYLVPADPAEGIPPVRELRAFVGERLPQFMAPAVFTELAALPLTPNGKIDRAALPVPDAVRPDITGYIAPSSPVEELLAGIWRELLGLERVGVNDNFFELGGHSLLVTQMVARIRAAGYDMSVGDLFEHPTITAVAPLIQANAEHSQARLAVKIRRGIVVPPVFAVHTITGEVAAYADLAGYLGEGQQFYGLQERGLTGDDPPLESVFEMATAYLDEVVRLQPDGPYLFVGHSAGCYATIEMARQMTAKGAEVGGVYLIAPPIGRYVRFSKSPRNRIRRADRRLLRNLNDAISAGGRRLSRKDEMRLLRRGGPDEKIPAAAREGDEHALRIMRAVTINGLVCTNYSNLMRYSLEPYDGRVVLFMPREDKAEKQHRTLRLWREALRQEPEIVDVPGAHNTVLDDAAETIGTWFKAEIARWQR
jgi:amino acid adenylation domain-containing protein